MSAKTRILFISLFVIMFSSLFGTSNHFVNIVSLNEQVSFPSFNSINATSPTEYFNETSFPRYHLVGRPLSLIRTPHKSLPAIIESDENLKIIVYADEETTNWQFKLVSATDNITLDVLDSTFELLGSYWEFQTIPTVYTPGLYDLQLNCSAGDDYQTHSVKIVNQKTYPFKILHISDSHFPSYDGRNTTAIDLEYIDEINSMDVDFAIFTGDLIEGGPATDFVNPTTGGPLAAEVQLKLGLWAFDLINLPIYYIGGNHDLDSSPLLPDTPAFVWMDYFGENYIHFNYLDWSFIGYTCSRSGLIAEDLNKVNSILSAEEDKPNVLFYHSDYQNHATNFRASYKIEIMLYGHEHQEEKYVSASTLYHCEAPMFNNESSIITILNGTAASLDDIEYDFSSLISTPTTKTTLSLMLVGVIPLLMVVVKFRKRETEKI
jgi:predicted phosphodiesterase